MEEIPESYYFVAVEDSVAAQPDDPFNLTEGLYDDLEDLGLELSQYQQIDDDVAVAADTLPVSFDLAESIEQDLQDLSFYSQLDDDLAVAPDTLAYLFDAGLDDDVTRADSAELSSYQQIDDDAAAVPETLLGRFDFIEDAAQFGDAETASFYTTQDDDPIVVIPPITTAGGIAGHGRVHVLPSRHQDRATDRHHVVTREPFAPLREVKQAKETGGDLKALRDRLLDLGRALERNKQTVKDRIRAEQARAESPELMAILQLLITEYELTLYNQNAARLLIILADDR